VTYTPSDSHYWVGPPPREVHRITTSTTEILHLAVAFAVLTGDIALLQARTFGAPISFSTNTLVLEFAVAFGAAATLTGFLAHELAHKIVAQRDGLWAEFRASAMGLVFSIVTAFLGFLFAAPGATVVNGYGGVREWGRISLAGPAVNLGFGGTFLAGSWVLGRLPNELLPSYGLALLAFINGWFAAFNLIPFGPLDGVKVWRWNRGLWIGSMAVSAGLAVTALLYLSSPGLF
jgi:Zn-dependent protease